MSQVHNMERKILKQTPLYMYPNGTFARSELPEEGCVKVEEPPVYEDVPIDDQTEDVKDG